jgi:hypothetical protein
MKFPDLPYYIVNEIDRPCERLIAQMQVDGTLNYVNPEMRGKKQYLGMSADDATPVEDFGITLTLHKNGLRGSHDPEKSEATYKDGKERRWQGSREFWFPLA